MLNLIVDSDSKTGQELLNSDNEIKLISNKTVFSSLNEEENVLKITSLKDIKIEILTKFLNNVVKNFEIQRKYYLEMSEKFSIQDETLLLDLVNKSECYNSVTTYLKMLKTEFEKEIK